MTVPPFLSRCQMQRSLSQWEPPLPGSPGAAAAQEGQSLKLDPDVKPGVKP